MTYPTAINESALRQPIVCLPRMLPRDLWLPAAHRAIAANPLNRAPVEQLGLAIPGFEPTEAHLAVLTTKYWRNGGVSLTVGFLDNPPADLRARILLHMNAWNVTANVRFVESTTSPQVRIARVQGDGYWSNLGTDILSIAADQPTMNLDSFTMNTPDSEFHRVVRHETGHTMGFPHEHMRRELVDRIDPAKAIAFFLQTQGWDEATVRQQVLTPIEDSSLLGTPHADPNSIMCYQIPGSITKDGQPIIGGLDIDQVDYEFAGQIYPKAVPSVQIANDSTAPRSRGLSPQPKARFAGTQLSVDVAIEAERYAAEKKYPLRIAARDIFHEAIRLDGRSSSPAEVAVSTSPDSASVSFHNDILPLFRPVDIAHMAPFGVLLNDYGYMSDSSNNHQNATSVRDSLLPTANPRMPIGGPFWGQATIDLFNEWMNDGFQP